MNYPNRYIERQSEAIRKALEYCRINNLDKSHIVPRRENGKMTGYYIIDETGSTAEEVIEI